MSHLGRPGGSVVESLRLKGVGSVASTLLGTEIRAAPDCVGREVQALSDDLEAGDVLLLENLRFHPGETRNDPEFARSLAAPADLYVNDAFGVAHRAHASVDAIREFLPSRAGLLMTREISVLERAIRRPDRPLVVILGGGKVRDKVPVLEGLMKVADTVLVGGAIANTFLAALGHSMGASLVEKDLVPVAARLIARAREADLEILFPTDVVLAQFANPDSPQETVMVERVPAGWQVLDIGPRTVERFRDKLEHAGTILWNGPMGVYEVGPFARGTRAVAEAVARSSAYSIIGGGDSAAVVDDLGLVGQIDHVSTGGGAMLALLAGQDLPGARGLKPLEEGDL